ncbi:hypothetical protein OSTOST_02448 [Ostertagia ostertagi]
MKNLYHADEQFLGFFKRNTENLDNAFLFFTSDHGPKSEGIGKVLLGQYEANNPFLIVSVPKRFRNTVIHDQLRNKSKMLMTPFDLHATFMDILKLQPSTNFSDTSYRNMEPLSKGSSLFREWREARNCRTLPIPSHYCLCQYNTTDIKADPAVSKAGEFLAEQLNVLLQNEELGEKCRNQSYLSVGAF